MARPRTIVIRAPGTNCDEETVFAWQRAGATVETWHVDRLIETPAELDRFQIVTIPGGFSYGDDEQLLVEILGSLKLTFMEVSRAAAGAAMGEKAKARP